MVDMEGWGGQSGRGGQGGRGRQGGQGGQGKGHFVWNSKVAAVPEGYLSGQLKILLEGEKIDNSNS